MFAPDGSVIVTATPLMESPLAGMARTLSWATAPIGYMAPVELQVQVTVGARASTMGCTLMATLLVRGLPAKSLPVTMMLFATGTVPSTAGAVTFAFQTLGLTGSGVMATLTPSIAALACFTPTSASKMVAATAMVLPETYVAPAAGAVMVTVGGLPSCRTVTAAWLVP